MIEELASGVAGSRVLLLRFLVFVSGVGRSVGRSVLGRSCAASFDSVLPSVLRSRLVVRPRLACGLKLQPEVKLHFCISYAPSITYSSV